MHNQFGQGSGGGPGGGPKPEDNAAEDGTGTLAEPFSDLEYPLIGRLVEAGDRLGRYRLGRILGRGGTGDVFLGYGIKPGTQRRVAVKVLQRGLGSSRLRQRFENECRILSSLEHPNIAILHDARADDSVRPYVVMEYIDGERIDVYCDRLRATIEDRLRLVRDLCSAVELAHSRRVVHLDIKPGNILVTGDGVAKLLDFGIAKLLDDESASAAPSEDPGESTVATSNRPLTLGYASPEQIAGKTLTTATDLYSLGMLVYKLLAGRLPFPAAQLRQKGQRQRFLAASEKPLPPSRSFELAGEEAPGSGGGVDSARADDQRGALVAKLRSTSIEELRTRLSGDLDAIILRAIAHRPQDRHPSAASFAAKLWAAIGHQD